jgi:hypothetical protein
MALAEYSVDDQSNAHLRLNATPHVIVKWRVVTRQYDQIDGVVVSGVVHRLEPLGAASSTVANVTRRHGNLSPH